MTINTLGLTIGVAGFLILGVYVQSEWSFDTFHEQGDQIYRVVETQHLPGVDEMDVAVTMPPLAPLLKENFPEIESTTRIIRSGSQTWRHKGENFSQSGFIYADSTFFDIFTFPLLYGDKKNALKQPYSLVLDESFAISVFGNENPVGKQLPVIWNGKKYPFEITGVMKEVPKNSHLQFSTIASLSTYESFGNDLGQIWGNSLATYVMLNEQASVEGLEAKFPGFVDKIIPDSFWPDGYLDLYLQPLNDIHLQSGHIKYQIQNYQQGDLTTIYIFGIVSLLIIIVACINYMNLTTARSAKRAEEVGIRKVFGSQKETIILQFILESVFLAALATFMGLLLASYLLPYFESLMNVSSSLSLFDSNTLLLQLIGITFAVGIIAGSYPALVLSSYKPASIIQGNYFHTGGGATLRKVLVGAQFVVVVVLLIVSGYVWNQMNYVTNKDIGFNRDDVLYVPLNSSESRSKIPLLKQELIRLGGVEAVTASVSPMPSGRGDMTVQVPGENPPKELLVRNSIVDPDYIDAVEMEMLRGRAFSPHIGADTVSSILVNEALVQNLGWEQPVGRELQVGSGEGSQMYTVVGVIKDFHYFDFKESIDPLVMRAKPTGLYNLMVRLEPDKVETAISALKEKWNAIFPAESFNYHFLDDLISRLYRSDRNYGILITSFSVLAILIAFLGLVGMATFMAEQKTKEIGIRKVLGGSITEIIFLINKPFLKLIAVSIAIAIPLGYWFGNRWLEIFKYYEQPGLTVYLGASAIVLLITYLTVSIQAYKAAILNPVETLKAE